MNTNYVFTGSDDIKTIPSSVTTSTSSDWGEEAGTTTTTPDSPWYIPFDYQKIVIPELWTQVYDFGRIGTIILRDRDGESYTIPVTEDFVSNLKDFLMELNLPKE